MNRFIVIAALGGFLGAWLSRFCQLTWREWEFYALIVPPLILFEWAIRTIEVWNRRAK